MVWVGVTEGGLRDCDAAGIDTRVVIFALPATRDWQRNQSLERLDHRRTVAEPQMGCIRAHGSGSSDTAHKPDTLPITGNGSALRHRRHNQ